MDEILKVLEQQRRFNDTIQEQCIALYTLCLSLSEQVAILIRRLHELEKQLEEGSGDGHRVDTTAPTTDSGGDDKTGSGGKDSGDHPAVVFPYSPN